MSTQELRIDEEFESLISPLTDDEYSRLEQSILTEGCREAIVVWNDTIIDGHHRYKICSKNGIAYSIVKKDFQDRNDAMLWMLQNQLGRRNLNKFQRVEIVRKYEDTVKAQAKQRQGTRNDLLSANEGDNSQVKLPESETEQSRDKLGKLAGVSGSTYEHASKVIDKAPTPIVNAARNNSISINAAY